MLLRSEEKERIREFVGKRLDGSRSGLLYLCGMPGTGKTSTLN